MSVNKLALIRYKTIDKCLQNRYRKWTLEDLIAAVSEALYEYEGIKSGVSKRTIQADIQLLRSDKLGYHAPIIVTDKKYYSYENKNFSITKMPINATEMEKMREIMSLLKQFNGFQYFDDLGATIAKLENSIYTKQKKSISYIQIENNHQLKGIEYIEPLFQATRQKKVMRIAYQSFKSPEPKQRIYYPYLLKEYRNRWFLIAKTSKIEVLQTLALDRIVSLEEVTDGIFLECNIDFEAYYNNTLGVTRSEKDEPKRVILRFNAVTAPYILTKPFHSSQEVLKNDPTEGVIISVNLILNFELEREILGFGEHVEVLSPRFLSNKIRRRIELAISQYKK